MSVLLVSWTVSENNRGENNVSNNDVKMLYSIGKLSSKVVIVIQEFSYIFLRNDLQFKHIFSGKNYSLLSLECNACG